MPLRTVIRALRSQFVPACRAARRWRGAAAIAGACLALTAGCAPTRFETQTDIPLPLIEKIPVTVGVYVPPEFRDKVYEEKREGGFEYSIGLGKAQSAGFMRIMEAMFARVVTVSSPSAAAATDPEIRGVLVPQLDDYAFVTPLDSGMKVYAASLKYTIRLYSPRGELAESWTFTGYGTHPASSIPGQGDEALASATRLAMRDAAAKLAAEFHEQAIARGLLPAATGAPAPAEIVPDTVPDVPDQP
jgi:hypothetical protein